MTVKYAKVAVFKTSSSYSAWAHMMASMYANKSGTESEDPAWTTDEQGKSKWYGFLQEYYTQTHLLGSFIAITTNPSSSHLEVCWTDEPLGVIDFSSCTAQLANYITDNLVNIHLHYVILQPLTQSRPRSPPPKETCKYCILLAN